MSQYLTIALPKGKLGYDAVELLARAGMPYKGLDVDGRKLLFEYEKDKIRYIICRPTDVPTYVEYGAADLGIVGKDTVVESNKDVFELVDLKFGYCRFVVALPKSVAQKILTEDGTVNLDILNHGRVATKFPRVAENFFASKGMQVEVIKLHGNIELAPMVGLSDMIVDIVSSGKTLKENNLTAVADIFHATARLIANRVSYRIKSQQVEKVAEALKCALVGGTNNA